MSVLGHAALNFRYWHLADVDADDEHVRFGVKRTSLSSLLMSANDPKQTNSRALSKDHSPTTVSAVRRSSFLDRVSKTSGEVNQLAMQVFRP